MPLLLLQSKTRKEVKGDLNEQRTHALKRLSMGFPEPFFKTELKSTSLNLPLALVLCRRILLTEPLSETMQGEVLG